MGVFSGLISFVVMVLLFSLSIFIHELGHLLVAMMCKMDVDAFSIGFGKAIWAREKWGVKWRIGMIPLGGYVALPQLDPEAMAAVQGKNDGEGDDAAASLKPAIAPWKKILVSLAGATGNVILAIVLAWIIYLAPSAPVASGDPWVGSVATNSAAYDAGLRPGDWIRSVRDEKVRSWDGFMIECVFAGGADSNVVVGVERDGEMLELSLPLTIGDSVKTHTRVEGVFKASIVAIASVTNAGPAQVAGLMSNDVVTAVDGVEVASWSHMSGLISAAGTNEMVISVRREEGEGKKRAVKELELAVTARFDEALDRSIIGITGMGASLPYIPWMQYKEPAAQLKHDASAIKRMLRALTSRRKGEAKAALGGMGGPMLILATTWLNAQAGLLIALGFIRFVNINLAILNLLPIPVLDGGHIIFALYEWIARRRVPPKVVNILVNTFAVLLIGFVVLITVLRDVPRLGFWASRLMAGPEAASTNALPAKVESTNAVPAEVALTNAVAVVESVE